MRTDANIVVIGGGIVGCSVLYHLSRYLGQDLLLVEKSNLTSGSTWHAAGNVTYFGHYPSITKLYVDSVKTYLRAEQETGIAVDFHETGSLRLATNQKELEAYNNLIPLYQQLNIEYRVIDRSEIESLHPFINTDGLLGAAYTPGDGHVNPSGATVAMAKAARDRGASIQQNCEITHIERHASGIWLLSTPDSQVIARLEIQSHRPTFAKKGNLFCVVYTSLIPSHGHLTEYRLITMVNCFRLISIDWRFI